MALAKTISITGLVLAATLTVATAAHADLVGFYQFNDAGNLGLDSSGHGNNLVVSGSGVTFTSSGATGGGLGLSGSGGLTTLSGDAPAGFPLGGSSYTISASFKDNAADNSGDHLGIIGWGNYGAYGQTNTIRLIDPAEGTYPGVDNYWWAYDLQGHANVNDGAWHNFTVSYDGLDRYLFVDNVLVAQDQPGTPDVQAQNFFIGEGCVICDNSQAFIGTLDNVAVFNSALTPDSVAAAEQAVAAVPAPGALALLGLGLIGLGRMRRKAKAV